AVVPTDDAAGGAILIRGKDAEAAAARVTQIRNLLVLAGTGTDITVRDTDHGGVKITTVDLGNLANLAGSLGLPATALGDARLEFSIAVRDDLVILAVGTGVVERILDTNASASLATNPGFTKVAGLAGLKGALHAYVAVDTATALIEKLVPASSLPASWADEIKPYLEHLAALAWTSTNVNATNASSLVLTVK
ncbi:MAG: hypothetical protein ABIV26_07485, partial [Candidatus Limnocylindrales bacterium]